jgi:hypothetical protein
MTNERFDFRFQICRSACAPSWLFSVVSCATQCELQNPLRICKTHGRHATKVAIINLSGLFEITITVKYLNFYVSEIWCKCTFLLLFKEYKTYFFHSLMYLLIYCFSIFVSLKQSLLTKKINIPKINFSIVLYVTMCKIGFNIK